MIPQVRALKAALLMVPKLPHGLVWAFTVTSDDNRGDMLPAFNVFVPDMTQANAVHKKLALTAPDTIGSDFTSYRLDGLLLSIIIGENDGPRTTGD